MNKTFSITHLVQFSETDLAGVVHFSNYFRWMEEVEHAWFRSLGLSVKMEHEGRIIGWPRVAVSCEYSGPARFEEQVTLLMKDIRIGVKSLNYEVEFLIGSARIAVGKSTSVCCAMTDQGFTSIPIPDELRKKMEAGPRPADIGR